MNENDPNQYIKPYLSDEMHFVFTPKKIYKSVDVYFTKYEIFSDENIFYGKSEGYDTLYLKEPKDFKESVEYPSKKNSLTSIFLRRSFFTTDINRSY